MTVDQGNQRKTSIMLGTLDEMLIANHNSTMKCQPKLSILGKKMTKQIKELDKSARFTLRKSSLKSSNSKMVGDHSQIPSKTVPSPISL